MLHGVHPNIAAAASGDLKHKPTKSPAIRKSDGTIDDAAAKEMMRIKNQIEEPAPSVAVQASANIDDLIHNTLLKDFEDQQRRVNPKHIIAFLDCVMTTFVGPNNVLNDASASNIDEWMTEPSSLRDQVRAILSFPRFCGAATDTRLPPGCRRLFLSSRAAATGVGWEHCLIRNCDRRHDPFLCLGSCSEDSAQVWEEYRAETCRWFCAVFEQHIWMHSVREGFFKFEQDLRQDFGTMCCLIHVS